MSDESSGRSRDAKEGRLKQVAYTVVLVPMLALLIFAFTSSSGPVEEVYGEVLELVSSPTWRGQRHHLLIRLDDGREVRSPIPDPSLFRESARIRLHRHDSKLSDAPVFVFRGYVDGGR